MDLQGRVKFPTGGGQVLERNRQADNEFFAANRDWKPQKYFLSFKVSNR